ncbi:MAG: hypothetical protein ACREKM_08265 [Longimicrobiales bacterium]
MEPERIELSSLAVDRDSSGFERRVHAIMRAAAPELARRAARDGVLVVLGQWLRPALAAAAVIAAVAAGALVNEMTDMPPATTTGVVQALGVVEPASNWLDEERDPTVSDLEMALMEDAR